MFELWRRSNVPSVLVGLILFLVGATGALAGPAPYGAYSLFSQGSGRVMGMGGVYAATIDDATGVEYNPATTALAKWRVDLGATNNRVDNHDPSSQTYSDSQIYLSQTQPYSYLFYTGAARLGPLVVGAGYSTPYQFIYSTTSQFSPGVDASIKVTSFDAMIAARLRENFGIGVTGHFEKLSESIKQYDQGPVEASGTAQSFSVGALYRTAKGGLGIVYFQGHRIALDSEVVNPTSLATWFRDVTIPALTTVGGFYRFNEHFIAGVDVDHFEIPTDAVDAISGLEMSDVPLSTGAKDIVHAGLEWQLIKEKDLNIVLRGGFYTEPGRILNSQSRLHRAYGLMVRFGPATLTVSFDQAAGFNNTTQGFSLALGEI